MANPYRDKIGRFSSGSGGRGGKSRGGKSSGTVKVSIPKKSNDLKAEQAQIFRDRQSAKMSARTTGRIYRKDGSVGGFAKGGGSVAANKKIRDAQAAAVRRIRRETATKAAELGLQVRPPKPVPSNNAKAVAKSVTRKPRKSRR